MDSGASNYISGNLRLFSQLKEMKGNNTFTRLDGTVKIVKHTGHVILNSEIVFNVLFIPDFKLNLLSVHKLVTSTKMEVVFNESKCIIHDTLSRTIRAEGAQKKGLYLLDDNIAYSVFNSSVKSCNTISTNFILWHDRLGHPSTEVLSKLQFVEFGESMHVCDVFHSAKQTRTPFPLSDINTIRCFELLHMDVWGPYHVASISSAKYFLTVVDDFSRSVWTFLCNINPIQLKLLLISLNMI